MASTALLEKRLKRIERDLSEIQKELLLRKLKQPRKRQSTKDPLKEWEALGKSISAKWKGRRDAVEEIRSQREKSW
jgi:hypothetical protein